MQQAKMLTEVTGDLLNEIRGRWLWVYVPQMKKLGRSWGGFPVEPVPFYFRVWCWILFQDKKAYRVFFTRMGLIDRYLLQTDLVLHDAVCVANT